MGLWKLLDHPRTALVVALGMGGIPFVLPVGPGIGIAMWIVAGIVVASSGAAWLRNRNSDLKSSVPEPVLLARAEAPVPVQAVTAQPIDLHRTPEELWALFDGLTDLQAAKVVESSLGKRMTLSGDVRNVWPWNGTSSQVTLETVPHHSIYLMFLDKSCVDRLSTLRQGDRVTVRGLVERIGRYDVQLAGCEFVD
jgi:hypothetical protein